MVSDPTLRATAPNKQDAEAAVIRLYERKHNPAQAEVTTIQLGPLKATVVWDDEARCYASLTENHEFASGGHTPEEAITMLIRGHIGAAKEQGLKIKFLSPSQLRQLERAVA